MKQKLIEIKRWIDSKNPYQRLKGTRNEIRLLIEEKEYWMAEYEKLRKEKFQAMQAQKRT